MDPRPSPSTVQVWAGMRKRRRCAHCQQFITWVTRMDTGTVLPFNDGFGVLETGRTDERQLPFEVLSFADLHRCPMRPKSPRPFRDRRKNGARLF